MAINFSTNNSTQKYTSNVVYVHFFSDATTNVNNNTTASHYPISTTFAKKYADTNLLLFGFTPTSGQSSYHAGCYAAISNGDTSGSNYHRKYDAAHFVTPPDNMNDDDIHGTLYWHGWWDASTLQGLNSTGNKTLFLGWSARDGGGNRPSNYWNTSNRSNRVRNKTTNIQIWEVYGNSTLIT